MAAERAGGRSPDVVPNVTDPRGPRTLTRTGNLMLPPLCNRGAKHSPASQSSGLGYSPHSASPWSHPRPFT